MKRFFTKTGIWLLAAAATIAVVLCVVSALSSGTGLLHNALGVIASPFRAAGSAVAGWVGGISQRFEDVETLQQENDELRQQIAELEHKSEYECSKIRADRYVTNGRYAAAISAYRALLADQKAGNPILVGNVWHNMGKAYTGLFRFREAADCYRKAYGFNENPESLRECLYAYRCLHDDDGFRNTVAECGMAAEEAAEAAHRLSELSRTDEIRQFEEQVDGLFADGQEDEITGILAEWKDTYRKNCRI